jgi:hypothetical protein
MQALMAVSANGNQVRVVIVALLAAQLFVMDLEISPRTADLASPAVTARYVFSELFITLGIEPQVRPSGIGNPAGPSHRRCNHRNPHHRGHPSEQRVLEETASSQKYHLSHPDANFGDAYATHSVTKDLCFNSLRPTEGSLEWLCGDSAGRLALGSAIHKTLQKVRRSAKAWPIMYGAPRQLRHLGFPPPRLLLQYCSHDSRAA